MTLENVAFLFPGQGAQYAGMGKDFAQQFAAAREAFEEAGDLLHKDIAHLSFEGPEDLLMETEACQPAIFVNSVAILRVVEELFPTLKPSVAAGLSLGEYAALQATGHLAYADALHAVAERGAAMAAACRQNPGGMAVVMGLEGSVVEEVVHSLALSHDLWAANFNCPGQVVISGTRRGLEMGTQALLAKGAKRILPLSVEGGFHSGLMIPAQETLKPYIDRLPVSDTTVDIVMNVPGDYVAGALEIRKNLLAQVVSPVRWENGIRAMIQEGVDLFVEIGCGNTLAGMNRRIGVTAPHVSVDKVGDLKKLEAVFH